MGIFSSDEEPSWSDVYNLQTENVMLELRIDKLRTCLQEIKVICDYENEYNSIGIDDYKKIIRDIVNLITKTESEENNV